MSVLEACRVCYSDKAGDRDAKAAQASQRRPVSASKTKIYMVLEDVTGGELFDKIASRGRLPEHEGRKLFQQLIDAVSYCHGKGVYHRDLKPENVLVDDKGNIKVSDFGLSALPQHLGVLANRGYDGSTSDIWSCGVILYVILTGSLPFDDRNLAVLYQKIFKGETHIPKWLTPGAKRMIRRILDPNPRTRITVEQIKSDDWFKECYTPAVADDEDDDVQIDHEALLIKEAAEIGDHENVPTLNNAFQLIGMSSWLDLSGFFEKEDVSERKIRFTSNYSPKDLFEKIEKIVTKMGLDVQKRHGKLKVVESSQGPKSLGSLSATVEVFGVSPSLYVVELRKLNGDSSLYRQLCTRLSNDLGECKSRELLTAPTQMVVEVASSMVEIPV